MASFGGRSTKPNTKHQISEQTDNSDTSDRESEWGGIEHSADEDGEDELEEGVLSNDFSIVYVASDSVLLCSWLGLQ